jgi:heme-degrading monooxygenase HmoA
MVNRNQLQVPYYAVIFSYIRSNELEGYQEMDELTLETVKNFTGYLGYESTGEGNRRIFISYWKDSESIEAWKNDPLHRLAKSKGKQWYSAYHSLICKVEHSASHGLWPL